MNITTFFNLNFILWPLEAQQNPEQNRDVHCTMYMTHVSMSHWNLLIFVCITHPSSDDQYVLPCMYFFSRRAPFVREKSIIDYHYWLYSFINIEEEEVKDDWRENMTQIETVL